MAEPTVQSGSSGGPVKYLQEMLTKKGFPTGTADGVFGPRTKEAVLAFQRALSLTADGIVGPKTWDALMNYSNVDEGYL